LVAPFDQKFCFTFFHRLENDRSVQGRTAWLKALVTPLHSETGTTHHYDFRWEFLIFKHFFLVFQKFKSNHVPVDWILQEQSTWRIP
jgi:hypothetical protein